MAQPPRRLCERSRLRSLPAPATTSTVPPARRATRLAGTEADQNRGVRFTEVVEVSQAVAATRSRTAKTDAVAALLRAAAPDEIGLVTSYLAGVLPQRRTGIGWRGLTDLPEPATAPTLTVADVDAALDRIGRLAGPGSRAERRTMVTGLFAAATSPEQAFLRGLITGEVRQGALDGIMLDAVAVAAEVPKALVRRAAMLCGSTSQVAVAALTAGPAELERFGLEVGRPVRPMLASSAPDVVGAIGKTATPGAPVAVDGKLDGIRVQVHKFDGEVTIYSRTLEPLGDRLPEVSAAVAALPARSIVLDGEAIAFDEAGRPRLFQDTASRTATVDVEAARQGLPLAARFFDVLHADGTDLIDAPARERFERLAELVPEELVVSRLLTADPEEAQQFFDATVASGLEGVVIKNLDAPYEAGRRGAAWVKVKPVHTLDLVVLAVEWGSGRRRGTLSNLHLGARDPASGGFVMLGKTFKGLTDDMLAWQTERFLDLETSRSGHVVHVRPEQVVEVAFDGVQRSTRYPGGVTLRFARVVRYRDDKAAAEADTIGAVQALRSP